MKGNEYINVAGIVRDSVVDGPGLRTVIFVQGCDHHCPGCHNPETQGIGGYFTPIEELAKELTKGDGDIRITLSGGEPMLQADALYELLYNVIQLKGKERGYNVWCYTGFTWEQVQANHSMARLASLCNVVVDGRFVIELRDPNLLFRGSSNQRLIDVRRTYETGTVTEWKES